MELLVTVVRQDAGPDLLRDHEDECVSASDGAGRRGYQLVVGDGLVEFRDLLPFDAMTEGGVDDHGDRVLGVLGHESHDRLVELLEAGLAPPLGGDVGTVDDHVANHGV